MESPQDPAPPRDSVPLDEARKDVLREAERCLQESRQGGPAEEAAGPLRSLLVFSLGPEWYAVDLAHLRRILRPAPVARVPGASPEVLGLMNCHGEVVCILDPRQVFGLGGNDVRMEGRLIVVLHFGEREAGLLVDAVDDVWEVPAPAVMPVLESLEPARARFFEGTVAHGDRLAGLLNVSACLNP